MYLYWLGESSFKIKSDQATVIFDPAHKNTGLPQTTVQGDIVILSHTLETDITRVTPLDKDKELFVVNSPGEYETKGIFMYALYGGESNTHEQKNLLTLIKADSIQIAHLAGLMGELSDKHMELMEGADIVLIPVGGNGVLSGKQADKIISELEPHIVIPMNFYLPKLENKRDPVDAFLQEMGAKDLRAETSLHITKSKLPQEETSIVLLQMSS